MKCKTCIAFPPPPPTKENKISVDKFRHLQWDTVNFTEKVHGVSFSRLTYNLCLGKYRDKLGGGGGDFVEEDPQPLVSSPTSAFVFHISSGNVEDHYV